MSTFAQTLDRLGIPPIASSRLIALLKANLGITLFSRDKRHRVTTTQGGIFDRQAHQTLKGVEELSTVATGLE